MIPNIFNFTANNNCFMIQRIQTLYLFVADLLIAVLFFVPFAEIAGKDGNLYLLNISGIVPVGTTGRPLLPGYWSVTVLVSLVLILLSLIIFQFKNRISQIRLSYVTLLILLGLTALLYFFVWRSNSLFGNGYSLKIFITFPLIAVVCVYLAIRGIVKDEKLVKSIDRIR